MKKTIFLTTLIVMVLATAVLSADAKKTGDGKAGAAAKPAVPATGVAGTPTIQGGDLRPETPDELKKQIAQLKIYKDCYDKCVGKISGGVIARTDGMVCIDLCLSDVMGAGQAQGSVTGRLFFKMPDGRVEKGVRIPVIILSLNMEPKQKPEGFDEKKKKLLELARAPIDSKKTIVCSTPKDYGNCGYGMEQDLSLFAGGTGYTDIDTGVFQGSGLPDGVYLLWVDWFIPGSTDAKTGTLLRWLFPIQIADGKPVNVELSEANVGYILSDFSRSYLSGGQGGGKSGDQK